jgi:peptidoglycan hydrolase-like protein with peptidoglycan-binding domain
VTRPFDLAGAAISRMPALKGDGRLTRPGRRLAVGLVLLVAAAGAAVAVTDPFAAGSPAASPVSDNGTAISLVAVKRQSLSSQTQVDGTLGYADTSTVSAPAGTAPSSVLQAEQALATARQTRAGALATLAADRQTLAQAQARLTADRLEERVDCAGAAAAQSTGSGGGTGNGGTGSGGSGNGGGSASPCASAAQAAASDQTALQSAQQKVAGDHGQVASAQTSMNGAAQSLVAAHSSAVVYDAGAVYTMLPQAGAVIRRGRPLYGIDGKPTVLLYGSGAAWRAFRPGMSPGGDVAELNRNLDALGYGRGLAGRSFTAATALAVRAFQAARGLPQTGILPLGSVAFAPGPVRVTSVTPTLGEAVQAGPVLSVTSTRHEVAIQLDAAQQSQIRAGDRVVVTLPDNSTTPGVVSKVGKVAITPSSDQTGGGSSTPTIEVDVRLLHQAAAGSLDQAPVSVSITTGSVSNVLVVPVNALLALAGGGYAVEVASAGGVHHLVAVEVGPVFDDADGLVQVSGSGLRAGQRVVVPSE